MRSDFSLNLTTSIALDPQGICAVYARYSSDLQRNSSIEDQIVQCRDWAAKQQLRVVDDFIFTDEGISGRTMERPGLQRLMELVRSKRAPFVALMCADSSRLTRDNADAHLLRKFFDFYSISIHFASTGMRSDAAGFGLQHTVVGMMDEEYSRSLGDKVLRGQKGAVLKGFTPAGRCYGYKNVPDEDPTRIGMYGRPEVIGVRLVIDPIQAIVVRRIFEMYARAEGGYQYIARCLNKEGILSPRKPQRLGLRGWSQATVKGILANQKYRGIVIFNRMKTVLHPEKGTTLHRRRPEQEWIRQEVPGLRIIDETTWDAVVAQRDRVRETSGSNKVGGLSRTVASRSYLFSGLLRCGQCGGSMTMSGGVNGSYRCNGARRRLGCTNKLGLRRASLEQQMIDTICARMLSEFDVETIKGMFLRELAVEQKRQSEQARFVSEQREALLSERQALTRRIENLAMAIADHGHSAILLAQLAQLESKASQLDELLKEQPPAPPPISSQEIDRFLRGALEDLSAVLRSDPIVAKQELQKRLGNLIMTPVIHNGLPAYEVTGNLTLLSSSDSVLLSGSLHSTTEQHAYKLPLTGLVLILENRSQVVRVELPPSINPAEVPLASAA